MNKLVVVFLLCLSPFCFATEQIRDVLTVENGFYHIQETPLSQLYDHEELSSILKHQRCTGSWRGYKASWALRDGFLWLTHIRKNPCSDSYESVEAKALFDGEEYPVKASWYNGNIALPVGEAKAVVREGSDESNSREDDLLGYDVEAFVFNFENGKLVSKGVELVQKRY